MAILLLHLLTVPACCALTEEQVQMFIDKNVTVTEDEDGKSWIFSHSAIPNHVVSHLYIMYDTNVDL